jgi:hypothetical protein
MAGRRLLGYVSLACGVAAWIILGLVLFSGGLDPRSSLAPLLKSATTAALAASVLAFVLGILAVFRGDQGVPAALGIGCSLLFMLAFSGLGWMFFG